MRKEIWEIEKVLSPNLIFFPGLVTTYRYSILKQSGYSKIPFLSQPGNCQRGTQCLSTVGRFHGYQIVLPKRENASFTQLWRGTWKGYFSSLRGKSTLRRRVDNYAIKEQYYVPSCPSSGACMWRNTCVYILRKAEAISDYRSRTFFF